MTRQSRGIEDKGGTHQQESDGNAGAPVVGASHRGEGPQHLQMAIACHSCQVRECVALHVDEQIHTVELLEGGQARVPSEVWR